MSGPSGVIAQLVSGSVSITGTPSVDVTDRAARLLGVVASITAAVDVSDRAARLVGSVVQGTAAALSGAWPVKVTDGVSAQAVKAASTAAVAADLAAVVSLSPNSPVFQRTSDLSVTATGAANAAVTLTLPAAGAGLFHYITAIHIQRTATAALAGTATLVVTTTNLPGALAWSFGNLMTAGGTQNDLVLPLLSPLKSSVANTASTIVAPVPGAAVLWRITVFYYTGP